MEKESTIHNLLNTIDSPEDLRRLSVNQLPEVCNELRQDNVGELTTIPDILQPLWER